MLHSFDVLAGRVVRDGKVAVLISPGYGAGWSTWEHDDKSRQLMVFEPEVVAWVLGGKQGPAPDLHKKYGDVVGRIYEGSGTQNLVVKWVPLGTRFRIQEYDGSESLVMDHDDRWYVA